MKVRTQILISFLILGLIIIASSVFGVFQIKNQLEEVGHFHTDALFAIQSLNSRLTEAVEESFAYVVYRPGHYQTVDDADARVDRSGKHTGQRNPLLGRIPAGMTPSLSQQSYMTVQKLNNF